MPKRKFQNNSNKYINFLLRKFTEIISFLNKPTLLMTTALIRCCVFNLLGMSCICIQLHI